MKGFALGHFETETKGGSEITNYYSVNVLVVSQLLFVHKFVLTLVLLGHEVPTP